jgi:hypothetical protein
MADSMRSLGVRGPVYTCGYQWTAYLRYHGIDAHQAPNLGRASHFSLRAPEPTAEDDVYVLTEQWTPPEHFAKFRESETLAVYPLVVGGVVDDRLRLVRFRRGPAKEEVASRPELPSLAPR